MQKLEKEREQNFLFSCVPDKILESIGFCKSEFLYGPFSGSYLRYAKNGLVAAAAIKYVYAAVLWVFYRTDAMPDIAVTFCRVINTIATMVSFHGLLVVVNASDFFLSRHHIQMKFWTLKATVLLVLIQGESASSLSTSHPCR